MRKSGIRYRWLRLRYETGSYCTAKRTHMWYTIRRWDIGRRGVIPSAMGLHLRGGTIKRWMRYIYGKLVRIWDKDGGSVLKKTHIRHSRSKSDIMGIEVRHSGWSCYIRGGSASHELKKQHSGSSWDTRRGAASKRADVGHRIQLYTG